MDWHLDLLAVLEYMLHKSGGGQFTDHIPKMMKLFLDSSEKLHWTTLATTSSDMELSHANRLIIREYINKYLGVK